METQQYYQSTGGSLPPEHPSYVTRKADDELFKLLMAGNYCYVLNSRQTGKSSLMLRTKKKLEENDVPCQVIDISQITNQDDTPQKWYGGFIKLLITKFSLPLNLLEQKSWIRERADLPCLIWLEDFFTTILLPNIQSNIVIFLDEIDSMITLNFKDDFLAFIRACYNKRAENSEYNRLTFCLLGVATPSDLIKDKQRTPFNIGKKIELTPFTFEEAKQSLTQGLEPKVPKPEAVLKRVLKWSGGQPFLTQKVCDLIATQVSCSHKKTAFIQELETRKSLPSGQWGLEETDGELDAVIDLLVQQKIIDDWRNESPQHLKTIENRFLQNNKNSVQILGLYQEIIEKPVPTSKYNTSNFLEAIIELKLSGLVINDQGYFKVYNPIYQTVFNNNWIQYIRSEINPWAKRIEKWHDSKKEDKSLLLIGDELDTFLGWADERSLSKKDYDFINACQQEEGNRLIAEAKAEGYRVIRQSKRNATIWSAIAFISVILFFVFSLIGISHNKKIKATNENLEEKNNNLTGSIKEKDEKLKNQDQEIENLNQQRENLNKNIADQNQRVQNLKKKTENLTQDNNLLAKNNQSLNNNLDNKEQQLQEVQITLDSTNSQLNETRENLKTEQQNLLQTENDLEKAEQQLFIAKEVTAIETESSQISEDFEFRQLDSLLAATKLAQRLKNLVKNEQDWRNYPTTKPLTNLQNILLNISEFNQLKYQDSVKKVIFSPDGNIFATLTKQEIKVHQANGVEIDTIKLKDDYKVRDIAFNAEGKLIFIAIKTITFINPNNREVIGGDLISEIEVNTWKKDRVIFQKNITIKIKNTNEEDIVDNYIYNMIISPNGEKIATLHQNNKVRLWNLDGSLITTFSITEAENSTFDEFIRLFAFSDFSSKFIKFSPDSTRIAIRDKDNQIKIWKLDENNQITLDKVIDGKDYFKNIKGYETPHSLSITDVTFSPQSQNLASNFLIFTLIHDAETIKGFPITESFIGIYDLEKDQYVLPFGLPNQKRPSIINITSEIQPKIVVGYQDGTIDTFSENSAMNGEWTQGLSFKAHTGSIDNLASNVNGLIISTDSQGNLKIITQGKLGYYNGYANYIHGSLWYKGIDRIYYPQTNKALTVYGNQDGSISIDEITYNSDGKSESENVLDTLEHGEPVFAVSISPNSKYIVSSSFQSLKIWSWDGKKGTLIKTVNTKFNSANLSDFESNINPISTLVFHPDSQKFVSGSIQGDIIIGDNKGKILKIIKTEHELINSISISPDGKTVASGDMNGVIQLWDEDGRLLKTYHRHNNEIDNIAFSNDGKLIISSSGDRINIWNRDGKTLASYPNDARSNVAFDNDTQSFYIDKGYEVYQKISFNLNGLIQQSCAWLESYLTTHQNDLQAEEIRKVCDSKK